MRLDKYLSQAGVGTRSEVKKQIRCGRVLLNSAIAKRPEQQVNENDEVQVDGEKIVLTTLQYFMLNKPSGVVSATTDREYTTVVELIAEPHVKDLFPVGRLDRDTEGFLLLTNDGVLAHELLSPKKHVSKTYFVRVAGKITEEDVELFASGVDIGDEKLTKPARLETIHEIGDETELLITITEGRYHQIKRMFQKIGKPVQYLKRLSMGNLSLDPALKPGEYRALSEEEIVSLKHSVSAEKVVE